MKIRDLNKEQIKTANNNSFSGTRGNTTEHEYKLYCGKVIEWRLSKRKTQKILDKIYQYFSKRLSLDSQHVSVMVAGASNYNSRLDKGDAILQTSADFCKWFEEIEEQATRNPYSRVEMLVKEINWGMRDNYDVNKQWKELAGRDRAIFEKVYEDWDSQKEFTSRTTPYKIYHNQIYVENLEQIPIYADNDFFVFIGNVSRLNKFEFFIESRNNTFRFDVCFTGF